MKNMVIKMICEIYEIKPFGESFNFSNIKSIIVILVYISGHTYITYITQLEISAVALLTLIYRNRSLKVCAVWVKINRLSG